MVLCSTSGKEKNFAYSHLHPSGRVYDANPKPVGIGFGGTQGNERIFIDEDFAKITIRHHAVDKTYQPGSLFPNQVTQVLVYIYDSSFVVLDIYNICCCRVIYQ